MRSAEFYITHQLRDLYQTRQSNARRVHLRNYDILRHTTLNLWNYQKDADKQTTAAQNLEAQMKSLDTTSATAATAFATAKATENEAATNSQQLTSNLRISNLEKLAKSQEQKYNEMSKELKNKRMQKNASGSHLSGYVASPENSTLLKNRNKSKQCVIDLSSEETEETTPQSTDLISSPIQIKRAAKRQRKEKLPHLLNKKTIQWKQAESKLYNPEHPVSTQLSPLQSNTIANPYTTNTSFAASNGTWRVPVLQAAPSALFLTQQQNPFGNHQYTRLPSCFQQLQ